MSAQQQENIRIDGEDLRMSSCPSLPIEEGLVIKRGELDGRSSALRRGYLGSWEIKDGKVHHIKTEGVYIMTAPSPLFAEWFSGTITITEGKQLKSSPVGFHRYERERIIEIVNGIVQNIEIINNTERAKKEGWRTLADYIEEDIEDDSEDAW